MSEGVRLNLRTILGNHFDEFIADFIYKPLERKVKEGEIDLIQLRRINEVLDKHGKEVFDLYSEQLGVITQHSINGGGIYVAKVGLTKDLEITNIVKFYSDRQSFENALRNQKAVFEILHSAGHGSVPEPIYNNPKLNVTVEPFFGDSLVGILQGKSEEEKEEILRRTLDAYSDLCAELTEHKDELGAIDSLLDFNYYFNRSFLGRIGKGLDSDSAKTLRIAYDENISSKLDSAEKFVIHGDLNPGNVLSNGEIKFIDFESLCFGFLEFDYVKLFTKAGVSDETKERLLKFAEEKNAEKGLKSSADVFYLNQITQDLTTATRYLQRSEQSETRTDKFENMARASYNLALRRIDGAISKGLIKEDFKVALERYVGEHEKRLYKVDNLDELLEEHNPHDSTSQQNLAYTESLDERLNEFFKDGPEEVEKELGKLKKNLYKTTWKGWAKRMALPLALVALALGFGAVGGMKVYKDMEISRIESERDYKKRENHFKDYFVDVYHAAARRILSIDNDALRVVDVFNPVRIEDRDKIEEMCKGYENVDPDLVRKMLIVNKIYGGGRTLKDDWKLVGVNYLFPFSHGHIWKYSAELTGTIFYDPEANLRFGIKVLSGLIKRHNGNLRVALTEYYGGGYGDSYLGEFDLDNPPEYAEFLAYNILHALSRDGVTRRSPYYTDRFGDLNSVGSAEDHPVWFWTEKVDGKGVRKYEGGEWK